MRQKRSFLLPALILPALVAFSARGDEVSFHPGQGAKVTKTFDSTTELTMDEMSLAIDGQEIDPSMMGGMEMEMTTDTVITITDEYGAMGDDRPAKLTRRFDKLSSTVSTSMSNAMVGDQDIDMDASSDLEGLVVVFSWNDEDGRYNLAFDEDFAGDEDLLEGLVEDTDLRGLLPSGEVSADDTWDADPQVIRDLLAPGGAVKLIPEDVPEMGMGMTGSGKQPTPDQFLGEMEGKVAAKYIGSRDEDGVMVGVIELTIEVSSNKDLTDMMAEMMEDAEIPGGEDMEMEFTAFDSEYTFEGEGELLWNLQAGVVHSLDLSGEVNQITDTQMNISVMGQDQSIEMSMTMAGTIEIEVSTGSGD